MPRALALLPSLIAQLGMRGCRAGVAKHRVCVKWALREYAEHEHRPCIWNIGCKNDRSLMSLDKSRYYVHIYTLPLHYSQTINPAIKLAKATPTPSHLPNPSLAAAFVLVATGVLAPPLVVRLPLADPVALALTLDPAPGTTV